MLIVEPIIIRVICKCGMPMEEGAPGAEPSYEQIETASEGEYGTGISIGFANAVTIAIVCWVMAIVVVAGIGALKIGAMK